MGKLGNFTPCNLYISIMTFGEIIPYVGGLAGVAAILTVFVNHFKYKRENNLGILQTQIQALQAQTQALQVQNQSMQTGFDLQLKALTESVNSWKGLWEASTQEVRELKIEIRELRNEIDKLRTENAELKGQLKEHYKLA